MTETNIFKNELTPGFLITYLLPQKMYKIDYISSNSFASTDVVKSYQGIVSSLILRSQQFLAIYPTLNQPSILIQYLKEIEDWTTTINTTQNKANIDDVMPNKDSNNNGLTTPKWHD